MTTLLKASIALNERLRCVYIKSHTVLGFFIDNDYKSAAKLHNLCEIFLRRWEKNEKNLLFLSPMPTYQG